VSAVRIATRGSDLALAQARGIAERIRKELGADAELVVVRTSGDRIQDVSLAKIGGKGLFVKEIEEALLAGDADVAVHSAKDLPPELAEGLALAAVPERVDPRDALVSRDRAMSLAALPQRARVGTGSVRRGAQLLALRPDLEVVPLRGNVPTRVGRLDDDALDAVVLACAGLDRLGLDHRICERLDPEHMLPAACQGTLALETRAGDALADALAALEEGDAALALAAERGFLATLEGDCTVPAAAHAVRRNGRLWLRALLASPDGRRIVHDEEAVALDADPASQRATARELGARVGRRVLDAGGREILDRLSAAGEEA